MIPATCHPDRQHKAKGLCHACYVRARYANDQALRERKAASVKAYQKANGRDKVSAAAKRAERRQAKLDSNGKPFAGPWKQHWRGGPTGLAVEWRGQGIVADKAKW